MVNGSAKQNNLPVYTFPEPEPTFFDLRAGVTIVSLILMAIGILIRDLRAFGLLAGLTLEMVTAYVGLAIIEATTMALGVAFGLFVALFYMRHEDGSIDSWTVGGLVVGLIIEAYNSYLAGAVNINQSGAMGGGTAGNIYLFGPQVTLFILSGGAALVWALLGKILAGAINEHRKLHAAWSVRRTEFFNARSQAVEKQERADAERQELRERRRQSRAEKHQRDHELELVRLKAQTQREPLGDGGNMRLASTFEDFAAALASGELTIDGLTGKRIGELFGVSEGTGRRWKTRAAENNGEGR